MKKTLLALVLILCFQYAYAQSDFFQDIRDGKLDSVESQLKNDQSLINTPNQSNYTPLIIAVYSGQLTIVECLLEYGADIGGEASEGTALHGAAYKGHVAIAKLLIDHKIDVNGTDQTGITALMYATLFGHTELAELLFANGANPLLKDNEGNSAVEYAKQLNLKELNTLYKTFKI